MEIQGFIQLIITINKIIFHIISFCTQTFLQIFPTAYGKEDIGHTLIKRQSANQLHRSPPLLSLPQFLSDLKPLHCPHLLSFIPLFQLNVSLLQWMSYSG